MSNLIKVVEELQEMVGDLQESNKTLTNTVLSLNTMVRGLQESNKEITTKAKRMAGVLFDLTTLVEQYRNDLANLKQDMESSNEPNPCDLVSVVRPPRQTASLQTELSNARSLLSAVEKENARLQRMLEG